MLRAEKMFKEYKNMKREMDTLRIQLETATGISVDDMIKSMTFRSTLDGDRVQTRAALGHLGPAALRAPVFLHAAGQVQRDPDQRAAKQRQPAPAALPLRAALLLCQVRGPSFPL